MSPASHPNEGIRLHPGRISETLYAAGRQAARISCPPAAIPAPGQYVLALPDGSAVNPAFENDSQVLAVPLFPAEIFAGGFLAAPPVPPSWGPGMELLLRSPSGNAIRLPAGIRRLALAGLGESAARLMPLVLRAVREDQAITLYTDAPLSPLPSAVEIYPLSALPEALAWADFLALDVPLDELPALRKRLEAQPGQPLACPAQVLIYAPMPCGGLAECGACAVEGRRGWLLACEDGPVFDLKDLRW